MAENPKEKHVKKRVGPISKKMCILFVRYLQSKEMPTFQELQEAGFRWSPIRLTDNHYQVNQTNDQPVVDVCDEDASRVGSPQSLSVSTADVPRQLKSTAFERCAQRGFKCGVTGSVAHVPDRGLYNIILSKCYHLMNKHFYNIRASPVINNNGFY